MLTRIWAFLLVLVFAGDAAAEVRVVASIPAIGSIAQEVVGSHGSVTSLAPATQDPHFVDGKPSMILTLNRADLLLQAGLGLEAGWLPTLIVGSRNPSIQTGRKGNLDLSTVAGALLEADGPLDRALGDVHPGGNPHYWLDPRRAPALADGIAARLAAIDPENAASYRSNAARFAAAVKERRAAWEAQFRPHRGRELVPFHRSLIYLQDWLGLGELAAVEPVPGISPSPSHLAGLILRIREKESKPVVVSEPWYNLRTAETVASKGGARMVRLPGDVGSVAGKTSYLDHMDEILRRLRAGLEGK